MTTTLPEPRIRPKSFTYRTNVGEVKGRTATLSCEGKPPLWVSSPPEFKGEAGHWTPEDLFVASIEVCLMLTFVGLAEKRGLAFESYESMAEGRLEWKSPSYRFTRVEVAPVVTLFEKSSFALAREIFETAHHTCLVANSVRCDVIVEPLYRLSQ